jgi:hypothetical protein
MDDVAAAEAMYVEAVEAGLPSGDALSPSYPMLNLARIIADRGDLDRAAELMDESLRLSQHVRHRGHGEPGAALLRRAGLARHKGDAAGALRRWMEVLNLAHQPGS